MNGEIDFPAHQLAFDRAREESFAARANIGIRRLLIITARGNDFDFEFQIGPAFLQRVDHESRLSQRELAPASAKHNLDAAWSIHRSIFCSGGCPQPQATRLTIPKRAANCRPPLDVPPKPSDSNPARAIR